MGPERWDQVEVQQNLGSGCSEPQCEPARNLRRAELVRRRSAGTLADTPRSSTSTSAPAGTSPMQQLLTAAVLLQLITVASPSFMHGVRLRPPARAAIALMTEIELPSARSMEFATQQSLRKVALYRASVETEVKNLRAQLETSSKEAEQKASSAGLSLPDDWALPMQMATKRTLRQVEMYGASMEAEMASLREQLESVQAELDELRAAAGKTE